MNFWQDEKQVRRLANWICAAMLALLIPVVAIAFFSRPSADDFIYARATHAVVEQYGADWPRILRAALDADLYFYNSWQGLYVSGFLLALQPAIFGGRWYGVTVVLVLALLFAGAYCLARAVTRRYLSRPGTATLFLTVLFTFAAVEGMPNQVEGLYWYNGAMNYIPFFALWMIVMAQMIAMLPGGSLRPARCRPLRTALCCALCLAIGGGHHVVILLTLMSLFFTLIWSLRKRSAWAAAPLAACLTGLYLNMTSPGTAVRMSGFSSASLPEAVFKSLILAGLSVIRWLDVPLLCLLLLATPVLLCIAKSSALPDAAFRRPWLLPAGTFVLMWGMLWLPSYTMGGIGPGRLNNIVWLTFLLGLLASWTCLLGWISRRKGWDPVRKTAHAMGSAHRVLAVSLAMVLCMACIGGHTVKEGLDNRFATSLEAAWELANGTPQAFAAALDEREQILTDDTITDAVIRPLNEDERPGLLYFSDVTPGPDSWGLTEYYGKQSVSVSDYE